jgi:hypothetical protein
MAKRHIVITEGVDRQFAVDGLAHLRLQDALSDPGATRLERDPASARPRDWVLRSLSGMAAPLPVQLPPSPAPPASPMTDG